MRHRLCTTLLWTALGTTGCFAPALASDPAAALEQRLQALERRLQALEEERPGAEGMQLLREDLADISERLDRTEKKTLMDKIDLGLSFRTRWDNFSFDDSASEVQNHHQNNYNVWSNRIRIRLAAEPYENLLFHGRLSVYKYWADVDWSTDRNWDASYSEIPSDNTVRLDRAYVDLLFPKLFVPLAFTVGRQPTVGGPPANIKDDTEQRSTFPSLAFEREIEGVNVTAGLRKFTGLEDSAVRAMYGKFLQPDNDQFIWSTSSTSNANAAVGDDVHMLWLQSETNLPDPLLSTKATLTYVRNWNYPGAPYESGTSQPGDLGWSETLAFTWIAEDFLDSGVTWFVSAAGSKTHGSGETLWMDKNKDKVKQPSEIFGMLSEDGEEDRTGYAVYLGFRATLPIHLLGRPKLGLEFNHGSRYWWTIHAGTEDALDKLATRGNAWEVYYLQPVIPGAVLRFGAVHVNYNYRTEKPPLGTPPPVDQILENYYILLDVNF